ncbi:hypothetical protein P5F03_15210, partial [Clostridium perfringens]|nr:hypothetical protein [Clostridium perfringens]
PLFTSAAASTISLAEGYFAAALVKSGVSTGTGVDHTTAAHVAKVVKSLLAAALVVGPVAVGTGVDDTITAHVLGVVKANGSAAFVVHASDTVGVWARGDVAIAAHQIGVVKLLISTLLNGAEGGAGKSTKNNEDL